MPSPDELDYPAKLENAKEKEETNKQDTGKEEDGKAIFEENKGVQVCIWRWNEYEFLFRNFNQFYETWYPTVPKTLLLLSKLYRSVGREAFEGLAQELVNGCILSLSTAFDTIKQRKGLVHGQLFLIKHLLILRDQIAPFEGSFSVRETNVDFHGFVEGLKGAYKELLKKSDKLFAFNMENSILGFLISSTPQVLETYEDARQVVNDMMPNTLR